MEKMVIEGGGTLNGTVTVSGSKNAALPLLAASLLIKGKITLKNVPSLSDINTMVKMLQKLGCKASNLKDGCLEIEVTKEGSCEAPYEMVRTMRASVVVLGPLLARRGKAVVSMPGGCVIGVRPIDLHLKGLEALGAKIKIEGGNVIAKAKKLRGTRIYLGGNSGSSVLATGNVMMAAVLAKGTTVIENAACEPEVKDLADFLVKAGAKIKGGGSPLVEIEGVDELHPVEHSVIADRIEAATFIITATACKGKVIVKGAQPEHLTAVIDKMKEIGAKINCKGKDITVSPPSPLRPVTVTTLPYPGFPTDVQAQLTALLSTVKGVSMITERIYPDRFMHVAELNRMGADIRKEGENAIINGVKFLSGAPVMASDLRASAALIIAGLMAKGKTDVLRIYHLDRGYEKIEQKLIKLGARIKRVQA